VHYVFDQQIQHLFLLEHLPLPSALQKLFVCSAPEFILLFTDLLAQNCSANCCQIHICFILNLQLLLYDEFNVCLLQYTIGDCSHCLFVLHTHDHALDSVFILPIDSFAVVKFYLDRSLKQHVASSKLNFIPTRYNDFGGILDRFVISFIFSKLFVERYVSIW